MAYKIVLDAGHGGTDPGAVYNGRNEKDDNLALAQAVGKILEDNGVDVVYTRTEDIYPDEVSFLPKILLPGRTAHKSLKFLP